MRYVVQDVQFSITAHVSKNIDDDKGTLHDAEIIVHLFLHVDAVQVPTSNYIML